MAKHAKIYPNHSTDLLRVKNSGDFKKGEIMDDIIILVDENGEEQEYELLDTIEYEGNRYVVLIQDDDDEVSILQIESEEDEELSLITCEDAVIEEVYHIFKEKNTENYDFDD